MTRQNHRDHSGKFVGALGERGGRPGDAMATHYYDIQFIHSHVRYWYHSGFAIPNSYVWLNNLIHAGVLECA